MNKKLFIIIAAVVVLASLGAASSFAWFTSSSEISETVSVGDVNGSLSGGAVSVFDGSNSVGSVDILNSGSIPLACRIGLIPSYFNGGTEVLESTDNLTFSADAGSPGWSAVKDRNGKWFLVYGTSNQSGNNCVYSKITGGMNMGHIAVKYTVSGKDPNLDLKVTAVPEVVQYSKADILSFPN